MTTFQGTLPALVTPFTRDNQVNVTVLRELVDHLLAKQVNGFYLCGSTGEGAFMSMEERQLVVETVAARVNGRVPILVHVGAAAVGDAARLAQHARAHGAAGVSSILPPVLYDPRGIVPYYETIACAVPDLAFFPYLFGGARDAVALLRDLIHIPNLAGTKYTGPNMYELSHLAALKDQDWTIFAGMDEQLLFGLMFGARANIGSTVNLMPGVFVELHRCFYANEWARALDLQKKLNRPIATWISFGFPGAFKATFQFLGFDCGEPRTPNLALTAVQRAELRAALQADGFFDLAAM
ncbi:MAG: dihydrodipicolinate synthase family protein [Chloroflexi bacterium]|nr:dihydrodipicolinate synthase family protein [Chloroflexota bacterium]